MRLTHAGWLLSLAQDRGLTQALLASIARTHAGVEYTRGVRGYHSTIVGECVEIHWTTRDRKPVEVLGVSARTLMRRLRALDPKLTPDVTGRKAFRNACALGAS